MPLAEQASEAGIKMMYQNVPLPGVVAKFGGGYVGAQQDAQGKALGEEAVRRFGLKAGDVAIVFGPFDQQPERYVREGATADALGGRRAQGHQAFRRRPNGRPIRTSPSR